MAQAKPILSDTGEIAPFDPHGDINSVGTRWTRRVRLFELLTTGKGIDDNERKKALLLHTAGLLVQDIFFTLNVSEPREGENVYGVTKPALSTYFTPQVNHTFERSNVRAMAQT